MENQLKKAVALVRKTGDRLVIYDSSRSEETFVVMSLKEYEKLVVGRSEVRGLTEDELLDKINRDIAIWKSEQPALNEAEYGKPEPKSEYFRGFPAFYETRGKEPEKRKRRSHWVIPKERKERAEEVIEEDRHYLEDVDY